MINYKELMDRITENPDEEIEFIFENNADDTKEKQDMFINNLKIDKKNVDLVIEKKNFLEEINGNEEALNMLSIDRLKKLEEYYDEKIKQNNEKIKKLKN